MGYGSGAGDRRRRSAPAIGAGRSAPVSAPKAHVTPTYAIMVEDARADQEPELHIERDVAWTTCGFEHIKSIKVVTTSNVKLQLCPTSDPKVYILTRIECTPEQMAKGW